MIESIQDLENDYINNFYTNFLDNPILAKEINMRFVANSYTFSQVQFTTSYQTRTVTPKPQKKKVQRLSS